MVELLSTNTRQKSVFRRCGWIVRLQEKTNAPHELVFFFFYFLIQITFDLVSVIAPPTGHLHVT